MYAFLVAFLLVLSILNPALGSIAFINPAPWVLNDDLTQNDAYSKGTNLNLAWATNNTMKPVSVYLYQLNSSLQAVGTNEKIVDSSVNTNNFNWIVGTTKNITFSQLFILSIYQEFGCCQHVADSSSVVFNITQSDITTTTSPSSTASPSDGNGGHAGNNNTGLAAGLTGTGVFLVMLAVATGCFVHGRRKGRAQAQAPGTAASVAGSTTHQPSTGMKAYNGVYQPSATTRWPLHHDGGICDAPEPVSEVDGQSPPGEIRGETLAHEPTNHSATPRVELYAPIVVNGKA